MRYLRIRERGYFLDEAQFSAHRGYLIGVSVYVYRDKEPECLHTPSGSPLSGFGRFCRVTHHNETSGAVWAFKSPLLLIRNNSSPYDDLPQVAT